MIDKIAALSSASQAAAKMTTGVGLGGAATQVTGPSFMDTLRSTAMNTVQTVQASEQASLGAMNGTTSLQDVVQETIKAELAVETALSVRNKVVEGYQEILRMPI